jgi:HlyD family secretion protein
MNKAIFSRLLEPRIVVSITAVVAVAAIGIVYVMSTMKPTASYVYPTTGPITQTVEASGAVQAANSIDLSFQLGGSIVNQGPVVGTHVYTGQTLASLSAADLSAVLEQARAMLAMQQANLDSLNAGARPEDVAVSQAAVSGAQSALLQSEQSALSSAQDAYIKSDDAIHNKVDQFFSNARSASPSLVLTLSSSQGASSIVAGRLTMETLLTTWQSYVNALPADPTALDVNSVVATTQQYLSQVRSYLDIVATGLTQAIPTTTYPLSAIQAYQSNVAVARANISADITALNAAQTGETAASAALATAQSQLALKQAPATASSVAAQEAQVASAQASVDAAAAQLQKTVIVAPISGTVTRNDAHVGETAAPGVSLITVNSDSQFQIEVYVSEADVANVHVGQAAQVTLDAYQGGVSFASHVIAVDPAATMQNGIPSYKVTLQFDANDPRVQAGMTGNVTITTAVAGSTLLVPTSAIITKGVSTYVLRAGASGDELVAVKIGISGGGQTQILSGITQSDRVESFGNQQ